MDQIILNMDLEKISHDDQNEEFIVKIKVEENSDEELFEEQLEEFDEEREENNSQKTSLEKNAETSLRNNFNMISTHDFKTGSKRKKRLSNPGEVKKYICTECGREYKYAHGLKEHVNLVHNIHNSKHHVCPTCSKPFSRPTEMKRHLETHAHKHEKKFTCELCMKDSACPAKRFTSAKTLKRHVTLMHERDNLPYKCEKCQKGFWQKDRYQFHLLKHEIGEDKIFQCTFCQKKYSQVEGLRAHLKMHSEQPDFICHHCGRPFSKRCKLEQHIKTHGSELPFECVYCSKRFSTKQVHRAHEKAHVKALHPELFPPARGTAETFPCPQCAKIFDKKHHLVRHAVSHSGIKNFACQFCNYSAFRADTLKTHISKLHNSSKKDAPDTPKAEPAKNINEQEVCQ